MVSRLSYIERLMVKLVKMNITKTPTGKYYVSIFTEQEIEELPKTNKQVGIDLGLKDL